MQPRRLIALVAIVLVCLAGIVFGAYRLGARAERIIADTELAVARADSEQRIAGLEHSLAVIDAGLVRVHADLGNLDRSIAGVGDWYKRVTRRLEEYARIAGLVVGIVPSGYSRPPQGRTIP